MSSMFESTSGKRPLSTTGLGVTLKHLMRLSASDLRLERISWPVRETLRIQRIAFQHRFRSAFEKSLPHTCELSANLMYYVNVI